jgi:hypothetical protein
VTEIRLDRDQLVELASLAAALVPTLEPEPYLTKAALATHLACGVRSIETAMSEGMPHSMIFGKAKFQIAQVEPWLQRHGYIERRLDGGCDNGAVSASGAAPLTRPAPDTERGTFDASEA